VFVGILTLNDLREEGEGEKGEGEKGREGKRGPIEIPAR